MSVLVDKRSGSGPDLFPRAVLYPPVRPRLAGRGARGAGADARTWRRCLRCIVYDTHITYSRINDTAGFGRIVTYSLK